MLSFQLSDAFIQKYVGKPEFANPLAAVTFYRTYSRPKDDGTYENWSDVCRRCIEGMYSIQKDYCNKHRKPWSDNKATRSAEEAFDRMFHHKWSPPGRGMWVMGTPLIHEHGIIESLNNCGFVSTKNIKHDGGYVFQWAMNALMLGIGTGFDTKGAGKIKVGTPHLNANIIVVIGDSRESWADSIRILIDSYLNSTYTVEFDYSQIRAAGSPIKRFGGTSSGPEPLIKLHQRIRSYLDRNSNETLTSQTIVDIYNAIGACVIAGNVRRSAEIAIGEIDDKDFLDLKNPQIHPERQDVAWASNNSIFAELGSAYNEIAERIIKNGEPGLNWMYNVNNYGRMNGTQDTNDKAVGFNPCQPGFATVLTPNGIRTFNDIDVGDTIWSGQQWTIVTNKQYTGFKPVQKYHTTAGQFIGTANHRVVQNGAKIEVENADTIDIATGILGDTNQLNPQDVMDGLVLGDGSVHKASNNLVYLCVGSKDYDYHYSEVSDLIVKHRPGLSNVAYEVVTTLSYTDLPHTYNRVIPNEFYYGNANKVCGFLRGLFSANGSVAAGGTRIQLKQTSLVLIRQVQEMLSALGITSYITTTKATDVVHHNGTYTSRESYALNISRDRYLFMQQIGFIQKYKTIGGEVSKNQKLSYDITKVENLGEHDVWDITVDVPEHTYWTGGLLVSNCSEQALESFELCTLADVYIDAHADIYDFHRSIKFAYLYAKTVTLLSEQITDPNTKAVMKRNRRIGLSLSGITKFIAANDINTLVKYMETGYEYVKHYDMRYSEWFGINRSNRMTTIKPGGTTGLVAATTPGIHYPHSEYYIRRIRLQENTPLVFILEAAGIKIEKDVYSDNTVVAEFPIHAGNNIESAKNVDMWRQLGLTALAQKYWSDNGVSVTVSFNPNEVKANDIAAALDIYQYQLKSVSFLPEIDGGSYRQMPYEEIAQERYNEIAAAINFNVFSTLGEYMNDSNKVADLYCSNASCAL